MLEVEIDRCERPCAGSIGVLDASQHNGWREVLEVCVGAWHGRILVVIAGNRLVGSDPIFDRPAAAMYACRRVEAAFRAL
jgi:hypothetical protein